MTIIETLYGCLIIMAIIIVALIWRIVVLTKSRNAYKAEMNEWIKDFMNLNKLTERVQKQANETIGLAKRIGLI